MSDKKLPDDLAKIRDELRDPSLHYRPECEGFRCGAHKSWDEGFNAAAEIMLKREAELKSAHADSERAIEKLDRVNEKLQARVSRLTEALKFYADQDNWSECTDQTTSHMIGPDDHVAIVPFGKKFKAGFKARQALAEEEQGK